jgi:hypothetical protein
MQHDYERHADHEPDTEICRMICDGGLAVCKVCGGAEGSLTTECPGYQLDPNMLDNIYAGKSDYHAGQWITT